MTSLELHYARGTGPYTPGESFGFTVYAVYSDGAWEETHSGETWTSSNQAVVRPSNAIPPLTAVGPGVADVTATYAGVAKSIRVEVHPACCQYPYMTVNLFFAPEVGKSTSGSAFLQEAPSRATNVTTTAIWTSSDPAIASVDAGRVTGHLPGTVEIRASQNGVTGLVRISVPPRR